MDLIALYGAPSQTGFGSAIFYEPTPQTNDLEQVALHCYRYFVGDLWEKFGETAWLRTWKQIYDRPSSKKPNIVAELTAIADQDVARYVPVLLLSDSDDDRKVQSVLASAYDNPNVTHLSVYTIGDGAALSGLLITGHRITGETTVLISLLD